MGSPPPSGPGAGQDASLADPAQFYDGLVAEAYAVLRSSPADPAVCARFIRRWGEPALELGCGDGEPLLALLAEGLQVEGLDSSADMLSRCRAQAISLGLDVVLHHATMQRFHLERVYRSIFLAGATFQLIVDAGGPEAALANIARHLDPAGAALVPLFRPLPPVRFGTWREHRTGPDTVLRFCVLSANEHQPTRRLDQWLRYEKLLDGALVDSTERPWRLRWYARGEFTAMACAAGLRVERVVGAGPPDDEADTGLFVLRPV